MVVVFGFLHTADIIFRCTLAFCSVPRNFPLRECGSWCPSFPKISESWFCKRCVLGVLVVLGVLGAGASCLGVASILVGLSPSPSDRLIKIQLASLQLCPYLQSPSPYISTPCIYRVILLNWNPQGQNDTWPKSQPEAVLNEWSLGTAALVGSLAFF